MKKIKLSSKLSLNKHKVAALNEAEQQHARGGLDPILISCFPHGCQLTVDFGYCAYTVKECETGDLKC